MNILDSDYYISKKNRTFSFFGIVGYKFLNKTYSKNVRRW